MIIDKHMRILYSNQRKQCLLKIINIQQGELPNQILVLQIRVNHIKGNLPWLVI